MARRLRLFDTPSGDGRRCQRRTQRHDHLPDGGHEKQLCPGLHDHPHAPRPGIENAPSRNRKRTLQRRHLAFGKRRRAARRAHRRSGRRRVRRGHPRRRRRIPDLLALQHRREYRNAPLRSRRRRRKGPLHLPRTRAFRPRSRTGRRLRVGLPDALLHAAAQGRRLLFGRLHRLRSG